MHHVVAGLELIEDNGRFLDLFAFDRFIQREDKPVRTHQIDDALLVDKFDILKTAQL